MPVITVITPDTQICQPYCWCTCLSLYRDVSKDKRWLSQPETPFLPTRAMQSQSWNDHVCVLFNYTCVVISEQRCVHTYVSHGICLLHTHLPPRYLLCSLKFSDARVRVFESAWVSECVSECECMWMNSLCAHVPMSECVSQHYPVPTSPH